VDILERVPVHAVPRLIDAVFRGEFIEDAVT
jgi:hypothetical protein